MFWLYPDTPVSKPGGHKGGPYSPPSMEHGSNQKQNGEHLGPGRFCPLEKPQTAYQAKYQRYRKGHSSAGWARFFKCDRQRGKVWRLSGHSNKPTSNGRSFARRRLRSACFIGWLRIFASSLQTREVVFSHFHARHMHEAGAPTLDTLRRQHVGRCVSLGQQDTKVLEKSWARGANNLLTWVAANKVLEPVG